MKYFRLVIPFVMLYLLLYREVKLNEASIAALISIFVISLYTTFKETIDQKIGYNRIVMLLLFITAVIGYFIFENTVLAFLALLLIVIMAINEYEIFNKKRGKAIIQR